MELEGVRRSGRFKGQRPVVEENTIDEAIGVDTEDSDDGFEHASYPSKKTSGSNATPVKLTGRSVVSKSPMSKSPNAASEVSGGKKRASANNGMNRNKKNKGETPTEDSRDTLTESESESEAVPSRVGSTMKKKKRAKSTWRTRSSPKPLYLAVAMLKPNQQDCVAKMGFGKLLDFKVDGIPSRLGFYVVDMFDPDKMEIKLASGSLLITKDIISEMLGLKNEGVNILKEEVSSNEQMIREWKDQFDVAEKDITPTLIKAKIRKSNVVDLNFKLNFIMLFVSTMGCCKKSGSCDLGILKHISPNTDLANINWCDYMWECLASCKTGWKRHLVNDFFCGPITLLTMIYVDGTKCKSLPMLRKRPPTSAWTMEVLKEREDEEFKAGGFGLGEKEPPFVEEEENGLPEDIEGFVWKLENYIQTIEKSRKSFEKTLAIGMEMFPNNALLKDMEIEYMVC